MNSQELQEKLDTFRWYHEIEVADGVKTKPPIRFTESWELIDRGMAGMNLRGLKVLDVGTRDGKYALLAEKAGASLVRAFDNDPSPGFLWLIEYLQSKIQFQELNLYNLTVFEIYDVVFFFGVLYHLRHPMNGLAVLARALKPGGKMYIESGMLDQLHELPLMFCPVRTSPYETTSCTFFNIKGLVETLWSFGLTVDDYCHHPSEEGKQVRRMWIEATKTHEVPDELKAYWNAIHKSHN
jgi:SAM-dependent methyltransferase